MSSKPTGSGLVSINGRPLFVEISGTGSQPFISMHGLGGSTNLFPIAPIIAEHFTLIRFDFEGSGQSPLGSGGLSMKKFVEDVKAILEYAGFKDTPAVLFGHSLGALTALHFASIHPELTSAVILSCPGLSRYGTPEGEASTKFLATSAREKGPFNMADFTAIKNTGPSASCVARALVRSAMQLSTPEGYAQTAEMIGATPPADFGKIVAKVLLIAGVHDQIASVAAAETIASQLTSAASTKVAGVEAGHQPAVEVPDAVVALLKEFLSF
ncbi:hypothetical protein MNV49_000238 [Pseudohyphozyma bogoriensis]|nr:hypothetical protein MNV49_000238 [Pseudohyphozyma bogoriensis]